MLTPFNAPTLVVALLVTVVGALILWSNPGRTVNRLVFTCSLHIAAWLACLYLSRRPGGDWESGLFWFRNLHAISASLPLHLFLIKEAIAGRPICWTLLWRGANAVWVGLTLLFTILPLTYYFIPADSTDLVKKWGWAHLPTIFGVRLLYLLLFADVIRTLKRLDGARRIELQVWLIGACATAATILVLDSVHSVTRRDIFVNYQPYVVLVFYLGTTYAITTARVFDARQIFSLVLSRVALVVVVALFAFIVDATLASFTTDFSIQVLVFFATAAIALWFAGVVNAWLSARLNLYPQATDARQAAHTVGSRETSGEKLEAAFLEILRGWGKSEQAMLFSGTKGALKGGGVDLPDANTVVELMRELEWATPERLARERPTPERQALARFLQDNRLGVLVLGEGTTLTVLVGVGVPATRRPYTYPQVTQLQEITSIIEGALERAHYSLKAQNAEQLATVGMLGAGLAHEIRNPLVTIKTFVQLLPQHYGEEAFRTKFFRLINDEVMRIDRLTEQLLDMASPRVYEAEAMALHPLLRTSLELVAAKAADRKIRIIVDFAAVPDLVLTDGSAAKQVLLNLALNAIHAVEPVPGERWIRVATRNVPNAVEMSVSDNGPGIAPEILPRLFQPFQTTKSSGFGLGLAICSDILSGLKATIAADPPRPGAGATFRVNFPCPPPSS